MHPFTPPQEQVLALISAGSSISQAAASAGIHRNTIHNWINSLPAFRDALSEARYWKAIFWREQAEELAALAVDAIRATLTDASVPAGVRLKAAQAILALASTPPPERHAADPFDLLFRPAPVGRQPQPAESGESMRNGQPVHNSAQPAADSATHPSPLADPASESVPNSAQPAPSKPQTIRSASPKIGRNQPCPCGSGRKFKRCCQSGNGSGNGPRPLDAAA
jgi:SEC-C motif